MSGYKTLPAEKFDEACAYIRALPAKGEPELMPLGEKLKPGVSPSDPAEVAMRSMIGKQFLMTVCEMPDGRTFHSIQPVLHPSFIVCMKDIPELLARHGMAIVQKDALDGLTRFTR